MEVIYGGDSWSSIKGVMWHPGRGDRYTKVLGRVASRRKGFKVVERKVTAATPQSHLKDRALKRGSAHTSKHRPTHVSKHMSIHMCKHL